MEFTCILYYILSALLGGLLSWLLLGGKGNELKRIQADGQRDKAALSSALNELSQFKNNAKAQITAKDAEISKLKKKTSFPGIIADAQEKEIKHWKQKAKDLETQLNASNKSKSSKASSKELHILQAELDLSDKSIQQKDARIKELKKALESSSNSAPTDKVRRLKKKLKKLKKKLKAHKASEGSVQTIEIKETLDIEKLSRLLSQGKLTSKTKKVSKKKNKADKKTD